MSSLIHLCVLLMTSVLFAESDKFSINSLMEAELWDPALRWARTPRDQHEGNPKISAPPKWQKNPVLCCTCQDFVKVTKPQVDLKIQLTMSTFCNMFITRVKNKCLGIGTKLKYKILQKLFPGKVPRDTCRKVKLCQY